MTLRSTSKMGFRTREPCKTCPYRKDVPVGLWHPDEYSNLAAQDQKEFGSLFGCHATGKEKGGPHVCAGWLLDQKSRGIPNLSLRIALIRSPDEAQPCLDEVHPPAGVEMYKSIEEMIEAQGFETKKGVFP